MVRVALISLGVRPGVPAEARRVCRLKVAPATRMCSFSPSMHTGWPSLTSSIEE